MATARRSSIYCTAFAFAALAVAFTGAALPAQAQSYFILYSIGSQAGDPNLPTGPLVQGQDGALYGGARSTVVNATNQDFKFTPAGTFTALNFTFGYSDYDSCGQGLTLAKDGNFYGTCKFSSPGENGYGWVYHMTPSGAVTFLHQFTNVSPEGANPTFPPIQGSDGNFYGTTSVGGVGTVGTFYKMTPTGTLTTLHGFVNGTDGNTPSTILVQGNDGNFYGGTATNIFKITASGKATNLHTLNGTSDGSDPINLVLGADGSFYGTTLFGGANSMGTFFKITASGKYTVLHDFTSADGRSTSDYLMQATDGTFYGAVLGGFTGNLGGLYKITTKGVYTLLHRFGGGGDGSNPYGGMFQATNGLLYGDTNAGGIHDGGVIYEVNANLPPFALLQSTSGKAGTSIGILGQGFLTATGVTFGGVAATFTAASDNYMTATVPAGGKTGPVVVLMPSGNLTSSKTFKVTPAVTSFTPPSGPVGTVVTITGSGLVQASKVTFGGVAATSFTVNSGTQVTATVPVGAKTGKIVITTPGGVATSAATFTVG